MPETWLKANTRALATGTIAVVLLALLGGVLASGLIGAADRAWLRVVGSMVVLVAAVLFAGFLRQMKRPRLACDGTHLLVYLSAGKPFPVPLEAVEVFFRGQGPAMLKGQNVNAKVATVVIRLAERAKDWQARDVKSALGAWRDGYITIRGTWCEPIDTEVIRRLNRSLQEAKEEREADR